MLIEPAEPGVPGSTLDEDPNQVQAGENPGQNPVEKYQTLLDLDSAALSKLNFILVFFRVLF
jgi:hypothetical protein